MARNKNKLSGPAEHDRRPLMTRMAAGVLALSMFMGGCSTEAKTGVPENTNTRTTQSAEDVDVASQSLDVAPVDGEAARTAQIKSMTEQMEGPAIIAATRVVDMLESASSGATPVWTGKGFSNKRSVVGPDGELETSDDNPVPETEVVYDPETGTVAFRSTDMTRGENDKKVFVSAWITFKLGKRLDVNRALTLKDFREILNHPNNLSVESIYTSNDSPYDVDDNYFMVEYSDDGELSVDGREWHRANAASIDPGTQDALNELLFTLGVASEKLLQRTVVK